MRGLRGGKTEECRGELIARERRGELSGPDCLALRAHLAECESCRVSREVFVDLDDVSGVDLHDGARIERMSTAARRWGQQHRRSRPRPWARAWIRRGPIRILAFAAVVLLIGGTASATMWWFRHPRVAVGSAVEPLERRAPQRPTTTGARRRAAIAVEPAAPAPAPLPETAPPVVAVPTPRPRPERVVALADGSASASALLRRAGEARRAGDAERAISLYRRLQQSFPRSSEATLSAVSLGGLLLERRLPRAALAQFDGYLGASKGGVLIPEALYGRGRALAALGDRQEERRTWDRLLADFSDSAYGPFARRRLQELK